MAKREEGRGVKYGRFLAAWVNHTISTIPEAERDEYRAKFLEELETYSFEPKKRGSPENSGCVREIRDIDELDIGDPVCFAKTVKESIHIMYQKGTSSRVLKSFKEHL